MSDAALQAVLRQFRCLASPSGTAALTDAQLLQRFVETRDEAAFEVLVWRHGPFVLGLCRKLLGHEHEAEDAFQATFLTLARKAGSIAQGKALAGWLHQVATHIALRLRSKLRLEMRQRRNIELSAVAGRDGDHGGLEDRELWGVLAEELLRLPERYRLPLVACYLQGKTQAVAARELNRPLGSMSHDLASGCALLRDRLAHRGVCLSTGAIVALLAEKTSAALASSLVSPTVTAALVFSAGLGVSTPAATLARGVIQSMMLSKVKAVATAFLILGVIAGGAVGLAQTTRSQPPVGVKSPGNAVEQPVRLDRLGDPLPPGAVARLGTMRFRHEGEACSLAFSPDGKILASACHIDQIVLWDAATGKELRRINTTEAGRQFPSHVFAIALSPDGKVVVSRGIDHTLCFWDVASGKQLRRLALDELLPGRPGPIYFSPDGKLLALALVAPDPLRWRSQPRLTLLDVASGKERLRLDFANGTNVHGFSPDSKAIVVTTAGVPDPQLWDVATGKLLRHLQAESFSFAFTPDGKLLASGGKDRIVLTDVATGEELARLEAAMDIVMSLTFTPDGKTLVAGCQDGKVRLWDVGTKKLRRAFEASAGFLRTTALSPDGKTVAVGTAYNTIRLWDVATGKEWFEEEQGHNASVNMVAFSPDGKLLASGGDNHQLRLWDFATGKQFRRLPTRSSSRAVAFSPDGKRLASVWTHHDTARVWDVASGREVLSLKHDGVETDEWGTLQGVVFTPDGRSVLTVDHRRSDATTRLHVWDARTGQHRREFHTWIEPDCMAVAPDSKTVALGSKRNSLQVWDVEVGKLVRSLPGHQQRVESVAFSPDGRTLASGSVDRTVRLWEVTTGLPIGTLHGHERAVTAVAFAPDGRFLASGSGANQYADEAKGPHRIRIWDISTGEEVSHFQGHGSDVRSLAFAPDGSRLVSGLRNSTVLVWDTTPLARLPARAAKDLSAEELDRLWAELAGQDAGRAYRAIGTLAATPRQAVQLLKARLQPARAAVDEERIRRLIVDLDREAFAVRQVASRELRRLGEQTVPALRRALATNPSVEVRWRLQRLLESFHPLHSPEVLRQVRAVQVLELIGTSEARQVLETLAKGAPGIRLPEEAKAARDHLTRRTAPGREE